MATATTQLLVDLDDSGAFATDITAYWVRDNGFDFPALGRNADLGLADMGRATFVLDNRDGRFSPSNSGSPYSPDWHTYHHIKATVTWNGTTYDVFYGVITQIRPDSRTRRQTCTVQASDLMYVLGRTDVSCGLMQGYTGPIVNRLIDYAEDGEIITNPLFDELQGLGGYTLIGTATLTRETTGPVLEGGASMKLLTPNGTDGARYTFSGYAGVKVRGVAYVQAEADEGLVFIQLATNLGNTATSADVAIKFGRWTRLEIDGTFDAGSTDQRIHVRRQSAGGSTGFRVGAVHMTPFVSAIDRAVDEGQSTLDAFTWNRGPALRAIQQVTENELGALFYMNGAGAAVFEDKAHRWVSPHTVSQATLTQYGTPDYLETADDRVKDVVLDFPRYIEGTAGTVLWTLDRLPLTLEASGSVTIEVDYGGGVAKTVILPDGGTDYFANSQPDGGGVDETANVLVLEWDDLGSGAVVTLQNQQTYAVYLTALQIRGTPIRVSSDRTPARATGANAPALAATLSHNFSLNGREPSVQAWANYLANRYDGPQPRVRLAFSVPWPNSIIQQFTDHGLGRQVSDRITWGETVLPFSLEVSGDWYIDRITRRIGGTDPVYYFEWSWDLVPVEASYFIIGTSTIGGAAVIAP